MSQYNSEKHRFMSRALALARGQNPAPNPRVGAVVVKEGCIIAEAAHEAAGEDHAEAAALKLAGEEAAGADLYVTLEPCCHSGGTKRTPPCTEAIIAAGISRVFAASVDPNPQVSGRGFNRLREAGIEVESGILAADEEYLNREYRHFRSTGLPWVHLKQAVSLDGYISEGRPERTLLSCGEALDRVHSLRAARQAVLAGGDTVIADDPQLTVRSHRVRREVFNRGGCGDGGPLRLVLEGRSPVPAESRVFDTAAAPTVLYTGDEDGARLSELSARGVDVVVCPGGPSLQAVFRDCAGRGIISVLVEAGGRLAAALHGSGLLNEVSLFYSPRILGAGIAASRGGGGDFTGPEWNALPPEQLGCDVLLNWYRSPEAA